MNKPTLTSTKTKKMDRKEDLLDKASIIVTVLCAILVVEGIGVIFNHIFGSTEHSFFYNFILGFGIITIVAFICAVLQEIFEK